MSAEEADESIVAKFRADEEGLPEGAIPVASLAVLWYIEPDGRDGIVSKFDGQQRVSVTVGDLVGLVHRYLHQDGD